MLMGKIVFYLYCYNAINSCIVLLCHIKDMVHHKLVGAQKIEKQFLLSWYIKKQPFSLLQALFVVLATYF